MQLKSQVLTQHSMPVKFKAKFFSAIDFSPLWSLIHEVVVQRIKFILASLFTVLHPWQLQLHAEEVLPHTCKNVVLVTGEGLREFSREIKCLSLKCCRWLQKCLIGNFYSIKLVGILSKISHVRKLYGKVFNWNLCNLIEHFIGVNQFVTYSIITKI